LSWNRSATFRKATIWLTSDAEVKDGYASDSDSIMTSASFS